MKDWAPTELVYSRFLDWLDQGVDSGGERYLEIRRRLELFFLRRNCDRADELADETLNRVARRLDEERTIDTPSPAHFCFAIAKLVFFESIRSRKSIAVVPIEEIEALAPPTGEENAADAERRLAALESCLETLSGSERELIVEYYRGEQREKIERRRALAAKLGVTMNALGIRACRLRDRLEACVNAQMDKL